MPELVRYQAAKKLLNELESVLAQHSTPQERQGGLSGLKKFPLARQRKVKPYLSRVEVQRKEVAARKEALENTPDYVPTPAEVEHLQAEQEAIRLENLVALAKKEERMSEYFKLKNGLEEYRKKEAALAPLVRRTRARRINEMTFKMDLQKDPRNQYQHTGNYAQRLRDETAKQRHA